MGTDVPTTATINTQYPGSTPADSPCVFTLATGDDRYPVLCRRDNKYAPVDFCKTCKHRDEGVA